MLATLMVFVGCESHLDVWKLDPNYSFILVGLDQYYELKTGRDPSTTVDWLQIYVTPAGKSYTRTMDSVTSQQLVFESDDKQLIARLLSASRQEIRGEVSHALCEPPSNSEVLHLLFYDRDLLRVGYFDYFDCADGQRGGVIGYGANTLLLSTDLPKLLKPLRTE
jgi:hypothetical protein